MKPRFNRQIANLRTYLRKRGAQIDAKRKTVIVDTEALNWKETERLRELERWGYKVNEQRKNPPETLPLHGYEMESESFVDFADEIMYLIKTNQ